MSFLEIVQAEHWKQTTVLGWVIALGGFGRFMATGEDIPANVVMLAAGCLGIGGLWQIGKRATHWDPEKERAHAEAEALRRSRLEEVEDERG